MPFILRKYPSRGMGIALIAAVLLSVADPCRANLRMPAGLDAGDEYRIAFVTLDTLTATSPDISTYNAFVTGEAAAAGSLVSGLDTDWFAIASTSDDFAPDNTMTDPSPPGDTGVPIYLVDGVTRVVDHYDDLWSASLSSAIGLTQFGEATQADQVWTGTNTNGEGFTFSLGSAGMFARTGNPNEADETWIDDDSGDATGSAHPLYALSGVLTAIPEPASSLLLGTVSCAALGLRRGARARR